MGTPAMTTRGFTEDDFKRVADVVHRAVGIAIGLAGKAKEDATKRERKNPGSIKAFMEYVGEGDDLKDIIELRNEVEEWVGTFRVPGGFEESSEI